jgi:hypothetical protein
VRCDVRDGRTGGADAQRGTDPDATGGTNDELLVGPGQPIEIDASSSTGTCLSGVLQFRYLADGDEVRAWSDDPVYLSAPVSDTDYTVQVRCSEDTACQVSELVAIAVACPETGNEHFNALAGQIKAASKTVWSWTGGALTYETFAGDLSEVDNYDTLGAGSFPAGIVDSGLGSSTTVVFSPSLNAGIFVVTHIPGFCNEDSYTGGGVGELNAPGGRDGFLLP